MIAKPGDRARQEQSPWLLEELAQKTGGLHFHVHDETQAREAAIKAGQALRNEYAIGYNPPESALGGKTHRVRVKVVIADASVYARDSY